MIQVHRLLAAIALPFCVVGCVTNSAIVVEPDFKSDATEFAIDRPTFGFKDSFYEVSFGEHHVKSINTSLTKTIDDRWVGSKTFNATRGNLLWKGKLDPELRLIDEYRKRSRQQLTFELHQGAEHKSRVECIGQAQKVRDKVTGFKNLISGREKRVKTGPMVIETPGIETWQSSQLECAIFESGTMWRLSIDQAVDTPMQVTVRSDDKNFEFRTITDFTDTVGRDPAKSRTVDRQTGHDKPAGLAMFDGSKQVGALSLRGDPQGVFIRNGLTEQTKNVVLSSIYAILLYEWTIGST